MSLSEAISQLEAAGVEEYTFADVLRLKNLINVLPFKLGKLKYEGKVTPFIHIPEVRYGKEPHQIYQAEKGIIYTLDLTEKVVFEVAGREGELRVEGSLYGEHIRLDLPPPPSFTSFEQRMGLARMLTEAWLQANELKEISLEEYKEAYPYFPEDLRKRIEGKWLPGDS